MKNAIVYITDGNNIDQLQFSISSLFKNCTKFNFDVHVISNKIKYDGDIYKHVNIIETDFSNTNGLIIPYGAPVHSTATFERLFIPTYDVLKKYDKILYVDCDTEFFQDISIIFEENFEDNEIIGVCEGYNSYHFHDCINRYNGENYDGFFNNNVTGPYINAGVILINNQILQNDYSQRILKIIEIYKKYNFLCCDQDIINMFFKIKVVDSKYNTFGCNDIDLIKDKIIVHYIGDGAKDKLKNKIKTEKESK